jgi:hypothetical protein
MDLIPLSSSPALPFDIAPDGTKLACQIVVGVHKDGSFALEERLPSGVPFDENNPAHMFGMFIVQNAQQLLGLAFQAKKEAKQIQQRDEVITRNILTGV